MTRRLVFVLFFFPVLLYAFLRWIVTGYSALDVMQDFDRWSDA